MSILCGAHEIEMSVVPGKMFTAMIFLFKILQDTQNSSDWNIYSQQTPNDWEKMKKKMKGGNRWFLKRYSDDIDLT